MASSKTVSANYETVTNNNGRKVKRSRCRRICSSPYLTLVLSFFLIASISFFIYAVVQSKKTKEDNTIVPTFINFTESQTTTLPPSRKVRSHVVSHPNQSQNVDLAIDSQTKMNCFFDSRSDINTNYTWKKLNEFDICAQKYSFIQSLNVFLVRNGFLFLNSEIFCPPLSQHAQCQTSTNYLILDNEKTDTDMHNKTYFLDKCQFQMKTFPNTEVEIKNVSFSKVDYNFSMKAFENMKVKCLFKEILKAQTNTTSETNEVTYKQLLLQVIKNEGVIEKIKSSNYSINDTNFLFIRFESLSKRSFHANLLQTKAFFEEKNASTLNGFTSRGSIREDGLVEFMEHLLVEETRHVTLHLDLEVEDMLQADHSFSHNCLSMECKYENSSISSSCVNPIKRYNHVLEYVKSFHEQYPNTPKLSVVAIRDFKNPQFDKDFYKLLKFLETTVDFSKTVILITGSQEEMSDYKTKINGRTILENSPMSLLYLPSSFKETHPAYLRNLTENSNKLTTPLDLQKTILHLFKHLNLSSTNSNVGSGRNLFENIPDERNCFAAMVPPMQCFCANFSDPSPDDETIIKNASDFVVATLNDICLKNLSAIECQEVSLNRTLSASWSLYGKELDENKEKQGNLLLILETLPTGRVYKAVVEVSYIEQIKLVGDIFFENEKVILETGRIMTTLDHTG